MNISENTQMLPPRMEHRLNHRFDNADADQSGTVTLEEMQAAAPQGADAARLESRFSKLDADANGEITREEQQAAAQQRLEKFAQHFGQQTGETVTSSKGDRIESMLQIMQSSDALSEEQQGQVSDALSQLAENTSRENMMDAIKLVNTILPSVNTEA